jgi:hypothetical protein
VLDRQLTRGDDALGLVADVEQDLVRSTLTMTPSTMSPSLKYLIVSSIAARKSSAEPMSLIATWGVVEIGWPLVAGVDEVSRASSELAVM